MSQHSKNDKGKVWGGPKNVYWIAALEEGVDDAVVEALPGGVVEEADEEGQAAALSQLHPVDQSWVS